MSDHGARPDLGGTDPVADLLATFLETGAVPSDAVAALDPGQQAELRAAQVALTPVRAELGAAVVWDAPATDLEETVVAAVAAAAAGRGDDLAVVPDHAVPATARPPARPAGAIASPPTSSTSSTPAFDAPGAEVHSLEDRLQRSERTEHRLRVVAVAASIVALLAVIIAVGAVARPDDQVATGPTPTSEAPTTGTTEPPVDLRRDLVASDLVPGVTGQVGFKETSSGLRIYFDADGLPGCEQGTVYEAWVKTKQGNDVSVGTFHAGVDVTLWAGVDLPEVRGFWVSLQDEGNHTPSDKRVVSASLVTPPPGTTTTHP